MKEDAPIEKHTKNIRTQCTIETQRIKLPFINDWNPDTDE